MAESPEMLAERVRSLAREPGPGTLALRLCRSAMEILGASGASMTFSSGQPGRTVMAASDVLAERFEALQDVLGEGPGLHAQTAGRMVTMALGAPSQESAMFAEMAGQFSSGHTLYAIPMRSFGSAFGVLMLYCVPGRWLARSSEDAQVVADAVGAAYLRDPQIADLSAAWVPRSRIHQATGMVVAHLRVAPEDALALLRGHAFSSGLTLDQVATQVIDRDFMVEQTDPREERP